MTNYILSIDPGKSTGITLLSYDATSLPALEGVWQFSGGVVGFLKWYCEHTWQYVEGAEVFIKNPPFHPDYGHDLGDWYEDWREDSSLTILAEKFTARGQNGFSLRTDALEPLRVEGAMIALGMMPDYSVAEKRWVDPAAQYIAGGKDKADKKRRQHRMLKDLGYYVTGKDVGCPDADDVRSSLAHSLGYLMRVEKHEPTYKAVSEWLERNPQ